MVNGNIKISNNNRYISIPKCPRIRIKKHRDFVGSIKSITVSKTSEDKYYISLLVEEVSESSISKSKAKRQARAAEVKAAKVKKNFDAILGWVIGILLAVAVIGIIAAGMYQHFTTTVSDSNYSAGLTDEGFVKGADLSSVTDLGLVGM